MLDVTSTLHVPPDHRVLGGHLFKHLHPHLSAEGEEGDREIRPHKPKEQRQKNKGGARNASWDK